MYKFLLIPILSIIGVSTIASSLDILLEKNEALVKCKNNLERVRISFEVIKNEKNEYSFEDTKIISEDTHSLNGHMSYFGTSVYNDIIVVEENTTSLRLHFSMCPVMINGNQLPYGYNSNGDIPYVSKERGIKDLKINFLELEESNGSCSDYGELYLNATLVAKEMNIKTEEENVTLIATEVPTSFVSDGRFCMGDIITSGQPRFNANSEQVVEIMSSHAIESKKSTTSK